MTGIYLKDSPVPPKFAYKKPLNLHWMKENDVDSDKHSFKQHAKGFTQATSLHGFQFIGEDGRNWFERYFKFSFHREFK